MFNMAALKKLFLKLRVIAIDQSLKTFYKPVSLSLISLQDSSSPIEQNKLRRSSCVIAGGK